MKTNYAWDILAARSVWSFGPGKFGANALLCELDEKNLIHTCKDTMIQGF